MAWSRHARAEVELAEKDGWTFTFDGRVNSFVSAGFGDAFPYPTPGPTMRDPNGLPVHPGFTVHTVMGAGAPGPGNGRADVGWPGNYGQQDANNRYLAIRVRSGMYGNILGFGVTRKVSDNTTIKGYISIWSTVESLGYDKWAPINAEAREGYFNVTGPAGTLTVGRTLGWLGRTSWEIDTAYGHGYGVGLPCTDALGPACGHIGTGEIFPGYGANVSYATPSVAGLQLHVGLFDPVVFSSSADDWSHSSAPRPEGAVTFEQPLPGLGKIKVGVEGLYQPISRIGTDASGNASKMSTAIWGASGGIRAELGPVRLGVSGFSGKGLGLFYALQRSSATEDGGPDKELRMFSGFYGQGGLAFGKLLLSGGFGLSLVNQTTFDKTDTTLSVIHYQRGVSGGVYYHATDSIVLGLDYFNFAAGWYGAPLAGGGKLKGETQVLNFVNGGVTYHW